MVVTLPDAEAGQPLARLDREALLAKGRRKTSQRIREEKVMASSTTTLPLPPLSRALRRKQEG
jgi:hypothetical protein